MPNETTTAAEPEDAGALAEMMAEAEEEEIEKERRAFWRVAYVEGLKVGVLPDVNARADVACDVADRALEDLDAKFFADEEDEAPEED